MDISKEEIQKSKEINLDMADFHTGGESTEDRQRKNRLLQSVGQIRQEIINTRMAVQDYGLSAIEAEIRVLQDERTAIIFGPASKEDLFAKVKEIVHDRKKEALQKHLLVPLSIQRENNILPFINAQLKKTFNEKGLWDLFFLAIDDEDLEDVIKQMPDTGLSKAERQARIKEINTEIEKLEGHLNDELATAKEELKERHIKESG